MPAVRTPKLEFEIFASEGNMLISFTELAKKRVRLPNSLISLLNLCTRRRTRWIHVMLCRFDLRSVEALGLRSRKFAYA